MIGHIKVRQRGATPGVARKEWRRISKTAWNDTGVYFHRHLIPRRFTEEGGRELGFTPRSPRYVARKRRLLGHNLPNVFSGESRALARIRDVRATAGGVRIVTKARGLNRRNPKSRINMAREFRRISPREARLITLTHGKSIDRELSTISTTSTKDI